MKENAEICNGITRREAIKFSTIAFLGAALATVMPASGAIKIADAKTKAKSVWTPKFTGKGSFKKYTKLTNEQVSKIASLCYSEAGNVKGSAYIASIMANRYELYGSGYKNLYSYVRESGWWAQAANRMDNMEATAKVEAVVDAILKTGKRTLPGFIDEYDIVEDIAYISGGAPRQRFTYDKGVTEVTTLYGGTWTFWRFIGVDKMPCGYNVKTKKKRPSKNCYKLTNS